jgi:hypothetical protein
MRPRASLKEVRHLEEKSSRGFRFLRHRHKQKVLLQYRDPPQKQTSDGSQQLTHPPKTEPCAISEPRSRTIVTNKRWYQYQWRNARNTTLVSEEIHLRNKVWWISTATKRCKQSYNDLTPPTTDPRQMVRATASSPSDKSHLRTLSIYEKSTPETKSDGSQQRAFTTENSDETQQSMSLMKTPGRWSTNKKSTASKDRTPNCWTNAASTTNGWQYPICYFRTEINLRNKCLMNLNNWKHQSKSDNSITKDRSGAPPHKQDAAQQRDPLQTKIDGPQQKQLTAPINHLKEEPSAPQSLSIFDST